MSTGPGVMVPGACPACGGQNLGVVRTQVGNWLHCATIGCPRPTALHEILTTCSQPEHIVDLRATDYSMQHPMIERLDGVLLDRCPLDAWMRSLLHAPQRPGRWIVSLPAEADDWETATWTPIEVSS